MRLWQAARARVDRWIAQRAAILNTAPQSNIVPPDDTDGVLQDIHWYNGIVGGAFQGYTLGNILSAQFFQAALQAHPGIPDEIAHGQFGTLHTWLRDNIYRHGKKYTAPELIERVTGGPMDVGPYISYLQNKYGELYDL